MHEMHLMKDLFNDLMTHVTKQNVTKVTKVYLRMGDFTEINPEIIDFFFKEKSKGTAVEGAQLQIEKSLTRELTLVSFDCE